MTALHSHWRADEHDGVPGVHEEHLALDGDASSFVYLVVIIYKIYKNDISLRKNDASYMYTFTTTALYFLKSQDCSNFDAVCLDMCLLLISGPWAVPPGKKDTRRHRKALEKPEHSLHTLQVIRKAAMFCLC